MNNKCLEKSNIQIEVDKLVSALTTKKKPITNALKKLNKTIDNSKENSYLTKLPKLLTYLTIITKRKTIEQKVDLKEAGIWNADNDGNILGLNNKGLGYVRWGNQLTNVCEDGYYTQTSENYKILLRVFADEDLCLEIADNILSKNRTNFLKLASFFRKQGLEEKEEETNDSDDFKGIEVFFNDGKRFEKIKIVGENVDWKVNKIIEVADIDIKEEVQELTIEHLLEVEIIIDKTDEIIKAIKDQEVKVLSTIKTNKVKNVFVMDMVKPYEALENL